MERPQLAQLNRGRRAVRLGITGGLAALFLAVSLWGLRGVPPAHADPGILYVDGATGSDTGSCGTTATPCQTISYTLNSQASVGDTIRVAQGTYTENLTINISVTLEGGYESVGWTRNITQYETIIDGSGSQTVWGDWDESAIYAPAVITDGGVLKMWYTGVDVTGTGRIGYAESADGVSWTRLITNPVLDAGAAGDWDEWGVGQPSVIKQGGLYKMWFFAGDDAGVKQIGYATSTTGIDWTKYAGNPVLTVGSSGAWDETEAGGPRVLFDGATYHLWYHGYSGNCCDSIGYATSPDGANWTKHPGNPVFGPGDPGEWDDSFVYATAIVSDSGQLHLWYSTSWVNNAGIGYVTSTNGISWTRFLTGPALPVGDPGEWDENFVSWPAVIRDGGTYRMWYRGQDVNWWTQLGYATSPDGISWTKSISNPVLSLGTPTQWGGPVVRFAGGSDGAVLDGLTITGGEDQLGGGVHAGGVDVTIRNCLIRDNFANGAPSNQGAGGVLGGVDGGQLTIIDSRIVNNQVNEGAGGVRVHGGALVMVNTLVADNVGDMGIHTNGPMDLMHVTVANNDGGVLINPEFSATLTMANSIVFGNGWSVSAERLGDAQVSYSDVEGGWSGAGNIDADPQFADAANGDYHLQGSSPAIDAGTPAGAPPADLDGTPRDAAPDMGAYEYERFDHDVAVVDVLPSGAVAVNVAFPIRATLYNVGNLAENNVPVLCEIEHDSASVYQQTVNSSQIQPLTWQVLDFPTYTPPNQGTYTLTCQSQLATDERPSNDTFTQTLTALAEIADVWTKDNPDDNGDVPSGLDNWYESPDLWVRNDDDGGLIHQDPIAGVTNTVYARLRNRGTVPISGTVDVYWIEPSLGVRCGDWAPIGAITFTNLLPGEVRIISTPWVPTRTGHTCLQDVIDSPQDPYNRGLECAPQWVPWDNNVEWRNVNIISNPSGGLLGALDVQQAEVQLVNVYNLPQDVDVVIERMTFPTTGTITVQLPAALFDRWQAYGGSWGEGIEVLTITKEISVTGAISATIGAIPMEAAEKATIGLRFDGPAGLEFEIAIRERIDGITIGGMAYQWAIPDTTPPDVVDTFPSDGAADVDMDDPIVITFDEEIGPLSLDLTLTPDPGGWSTTWNEAGTVVTATHAAFVGETIYTATVTAKDAAANPMTAPLGWSFTTKRYRTYLPLVIKQ